MYFCFSSILAYFFIRFVQRYVLLFIARIFAVHCKFDHIFKEHTCVIGTLKIYFTSKSQYFYFLTSIILFSRILLLYESLVFAFYPLTIKYYCLKNSFLCYDYKLMINICIDRVWPTRFVVFSKNKSNILFK